MRKNIIAIIAVLAIAITALSACTKPADNTDVQTTSVANENGKAVWAETTGPIEAEWPEDCVKLRVE
ncbi:MAG: hypothetical protein ACI4KD_07240 [Oscillospiraceae bacterium]